MKKSDALRVKTRKMIAKNLIVLVVLAVVAFAGTASWFKSDPNANARGLQVKATAPNGLEYFIVAPDDISTHEQGYNAINTWISTYNTAHSSETGHVAKKWHEGNLTIDYEDAEFGFLQNLFICETTSDGYTFKIPKLQQFGEIAYVLENEAFDEANANEQYLSFDIYFRSKTPNDVKLRYTSSLAPTGTPGTASAEEMKHAAIGAVRLSVYNGTDRELLWIPGPHIWFNGADNNGEGTLYLNQTTYPTDRGNVYYNGSGYALYEERTIDHAYYSESNNTRTRVIESSDVAANNIVASTGIGANEYKLGTSNINDISVCTLDNTHYDSTNGYYYNRIRVNLWIEGEDAESRLKFVGGMFNLQLNFDVND